jgi:uncharacterized membrane protein YsdA (DUF1294 family)/cold shock CspA family protein
MAPGAERIDGLLVSWKDSRGFGFLAPAGGGADVFVHISEFVDASRRPLLGDAFTFEMGATPDGKIRARRVLALGATLEDTPPPARRALNLGLAGYLAVAAFVVLFVLIATERDLPLWVIGLYLGTSILTFLVYADDKSAAAKGRWRTPEGSLLALGLVGGWPGAVVAQRMLRHKTRKMSFQLAFWGTVALNVAAFVTFSSPEFLELVARLSEP